MTKNQKNYLYICTSIFLVILIIFLSSKIKPKYNSKNINTSTVIPSNANKDIEKYNFIFKKSVSSLLWKNYDNKFKDITVTEYNIENTNLKNLTDTLAEKYEFNNSERTISDSNNIIWKSDNKSILYLSRDNVIKIEFNLPKTIKIGFSKPELTSYIKSYISNILPNKELQVSNIEYFLEDKNIPIIGNMENSKLAKVNLIQSLNGFRIIPQNLSSEYSVSIIIDSNLKVRSVTIKNLIDNYIKTNKSINISNTLINKINVDNIHRLSQFTIENESIINRNVEKNILSISSINIAYLIINNKLSPVFYINGNIINDKNSFDNITFVSPISIPEP